MSAIVVELLFVPIVPGHELVGNAKETKVDRIRDITPVTVGYAAKESIQHVEDLARHIERSKSKCLPIRELSDEWTLIHFIL